MQHGGDRGGPNTVPRFSCCAGHFHAALETHRPTSLSLAPCWRPSPEELPAEVAALMRPVTSAAQWSHLSRRPLLVGHAVSGAAKVTEPARASAAVHAGSVERLGVANCHHFHRAGRHGSQQKSASITREDAASVTTYIFIYLLTR